MHQILQCNIHFSGHISCILMIANHSQFLWIPGIMHLISHHNDFPFGITHQILQFNILFSGHISCIFMFANHSQFLSIPWYYAPNLSPQWFFLLVLCTKYYNSMFWYYAPNFSIQSYSLWYYAPNISIQYLLLKYHILYFSWLQTIQHSYSFLVLCTFICWYYAPALHSILTSIIQTKYYRYYAPHFHYTINSTLYYTQLSGITHLHSSHRITAHYFLYNNFYTNLRYVFLTLQSHSTISP